MSIVVGQTLPYTRSELKLDDGKRWSRLFPLLRPCVNILELNSGHSAMVDPTLAKTKNVLLAAIGGTGNNLSSKLLSDSHLSLFTAEESGKQTVSIQDISKVLGESAHPVENGLVVVRIGSKQELKVVSRSVAEVTVLGQLEFDHVLSLLSSSSTTTKVSFEETNSLLDHFIRSAMKTTSTFQQGKTGDNPSVAHITGTAGFKSAKKALDRDLSHILSTRPVEQSGLHAVHFSDINGLSRLEVNILAHEILEYLEKKSLRSYVTQSTILNTQSQARGWAISLCTVPSKLLVMRKRPQNNLAQEPTTTSSSKPRKGNSKIQISDSQVRKMIVAGCESVIKDEPKITEYDTIVGDGDCGYTLRDGAKKVLNFIGNADLSQLPSTLSDLVDDLEVDMGGTSGALYCIFLSSLALNLWDARDFPEALQASLDHLLKYTRARLGDRTCLDCLIPFVETLKETGDSKKALEKAEKGVESTKALEAKVGRSSYLEEAATRGVPDPGAYGLLKLLEGMVAAQ